ncbi:MAG: type II secretion system F family protein [Acetivibrionales bacterium]|jgi:type IV pilus assembly protein PilC
MPSYNYEAINKQGQLVKGQIVSESYSLATDRLKDSGLSIIDLSEGTKKTKSSFIISKKKVKIEELTLFSRQLSAMLSSGIPVTRALSTLSRQTDNSTLSEALESIAGNVEGGMNLTDAFSAYPDIFNELYISMINAGEVGGTLETSLLRLSEQLQRQKELQDDVKSALSYPKVIGIFAIIVFLVMLVFLVPVFERSTPQGTEINAITQFVYNVSHSLRSSPLIWVLVIGLLTAAIVLFTKSPVGHRLWEKNKIKMPIFGSLILKTVIAKFTRTFSTLIEGGIPVVQALMSAGPTSGSEVLNEAVQLAAARIEEGRTIASTLEESEVFPPMVTQMIAVGEESGSLPTLLNKVAEFYEQEVRTEARGLQALIQPLAIIVIGVLIGGMLIALYAPIFSSISSAGG